MTNCIVYSCRAVKHLDKAKEDSAQHRALLMQAQEFGRSPDVLFKTSHPRKKARESRSGVSKLLGSCFCSSPAE